MNRQAVLAALAAVAGAALHLALLPEASRERSDLPLYLDSSLRWASGEAPYREIPFEYPPAALLLIRVPLHLAAATGLRYETAFAVWMALFDALALGAAWLAGRARDRARAGDAAGLAGDRVAAAAGDGAADRGAPEWRGWASMAVAWALLALCGSVLHTRFDLAPGALMALAVAVASPAAAGALLGAAAALKLYPLAIAPAAAAFVFRRGGAAALRRALAFGLLALLLPSLPAALEGGTRSFGFLAYHAQRGLQMQSLWAAAAMVLARLREVPIHLVHAFGAEELESAPPGLAALSLLLQLACGLAAARAVLRGASLRVAALAAFAGFVAFGKVGSPQFFLALVPLAACAAAEAPLEAAAIALAAALLAWEFPRHYGALFHNQGPWSLVVLARMLLVSAAALRLLLRRGKAPTAPSTTGGGVENV